MTVKPATLHRALAYLAITGGKSGLHMDTSIAMSRYYDFVPEEYKIGDTVLTMHKYRLNAAGLELAQKSKLWRAHERALALGFYFRDGRRRQTLRFIRYYHREDMVNNDERGAFISSDSLYVQPAEGMAPDGKSWSFIKEEF